MDPKDIGAAPGAAAQEEAEKKEGAAATDTAGKEGESGTGTEATGEGATGEADPNQSDENSKRVNGLMSEWHKDQHGRTVAEGRNKELETENAALKQQRTSNEEDTPYWEKDDWKPETYKEIGKALSDSRKMGIKDALAEMGRTSQQGQDIQDKVNTVIAQIKEVDQEFDDKDFKEYVERNRIEITTPRGLQSAYSTYVEIREARKASGKSAKENKEGRDKDQTNKPGSTGTGEGSKGTTYQSRKGRSIFEVAMDGFNKRK